VYKNLKILSYSLKSATAKDTLILFVGNGLSAFLGFVFIVIIARVLSVADFGVFSAAHNLILIIASITDLGISSGVVNFVAKAREKRKVEEELEYIKAAYLIRALAVFVFALPILFFPQFFANRFLATGDLSVSLWVVVVTAAFFSWTFLPFILQARKEFLKSSILDVSLGVVRAVFIVAFYLLGARSLNYAFLAYLLGSLAGLLLGLRYTGLEFVREKPGREVYGSLLKFSGWLGVNRIVSAVSGRLDVAMLAVMLGATATGFYSIPSRLSLFVIVLTSSLTGVFSPRFAGFMNKDKEKIYLIKTVLFLVPILLGIAVWILLAKPFIYILFGEKYLPAVPVFQALTASMIPFVIAVPAVTAIIYAMRKTVYIGAFSLFQITATFLLNLVFIARYGVFGPTITFAIIHTILATYSWGIVFNYYWRSK
jgi:O-antigen/teichoic acid export membrane protein